MSQSNSFPLYFTLERVDNGYILTAKEESGSLTQEAVFRKEVVTEDKIHSRIGQLLHPDALNKEFPVVFRIEAAGLNTYKTDVEAPTDNLMEAKVAYAHFVPKNISNDTVVALVIEDTQTVEVYGLDAENIAKRNNIKVIRSGGIPLLRFPYSKDGQKHLASMCAKISIHNVTHREVLQWYAEHMIETETASPAKPSNNQQ